MLTKQGMQDDGIFPSQQYHNLCWYLDGGLKIRCWPLGKVKRGIANKATQMQKLTTTKGYAEIN